MSEKRLEQLYLRIYEDFIKEIDAIDNGVMAFPSEYEPPYMIKTHLSGRVGRLNSPWNKDLD